jgi:hypothetical protein
MLPVQHNEVGTFGVCRSTTTPAEPGSSGLPTGRQGTARSEDVYYQSGGTRYLLNLGVGVQVRNDERSC